MKDFTISVTDNNTLVVRADSQRFGKNAILFEGRTFMACCDYIRRITQRTKFSLQSLNGVPMFTDADGRTMPRFLEVVFK